jgi:hypothetical protein
VVTTTVGDESMASVSVIAEDGPLAILSTLRLGLGGQSNLAGGYVDRGAKGPGRVDSRGNIKGVSVTQPEVSGTRLKLLRDVVPGLNRAGSYCSF